MLDKGGKDAHLIKMILTLLLVECVVPWQGRNHLFLIHAQIKIILGYSDTNGSLYLIINFEISGLIK